MSALGSYLKVFLVAALFLGAFFVHQRYSVRTVPEDATLMEPSVRRLSLRLLRTDPAPPPRGSIVWFEHPEFPRKVLISRVIGIAGDRIAFEGGKLVRNGETVAEEYAIRRPANETLVEIVVPEGTLYLVNDARDEPWSSFRDSRRLGPIALAAVIGKMPDPAAERRAAESKGGGASRERGRG